MNDNFKDMLSELSAAQVEFLIVGAYAMAAHGLPRATGDIDFWVRPSSDNADRLMTALHAFKAPLFDVSVEDFAKPGTVFQIGVPPERIDILTAIDGVTFDEAWPNRKEMVIDGFKVYALGREHLLVNKRASGRPKDLVDVKWLEKHTGG